MCAQLKNDVIFSNLDMQATVTTHKEGCASRILTSAIEREKISNKLVSSNDPLNPVSRPPDIIT